MSPSISGRISELLKCVGEGQEVLKGIAESNILTPESLVSEIYNVTDKISQLSVDISRQKKVAEQNKTVVLYGKFSTGKTTLISALLSSQAKKFPELPIGDEPTTAKPVRLTYSEDLEPDEVACKIAYTDGSISEENNVGKINDLITTNNARDSKGIEEIVIETGNRLLMSFDILDLPGTGTAFHKAHEAIVRSRLRDGAVIIWISGGPDEQFPDIDDKHLLRELLDENARKVIPVWNCKQTKNESLSSSPKQKTYKSEAERLSEENNDNVSGIAAIDTIMVWAHDALIDASEGWQVRTGIQDLFVQIEKLTLDAINSEELASKSLNEIKKKLVDHFRSANGRIYQSLDGRKEEKSNVAKALRKLDYLVFDSNDEVKMVAEEFGRRVSQENLLPILREFIDSETTAGGVLHTGINEISKTLKQTDSLKQMKSFFRRFSSNVEVALKLRLETSLSLSGSDSWFDEAITQVSEDAEITIKRKWTLFSQEMEDLGFTGQRTGDNGEPVSGPPPEDTIVNLARDLKKRILENITSLIGILAVEITAIIMIASPKTGTIYDLVLLTGGLVVGKLIMSTMKKRMLGRVRLAGYEIDIHLRKLIRKPLKTIIKKLENSWSKILDINIVDKIVQRHKDYSKQLREVVSNIHDLDF